MKITVKSLDSGSAEFDVSEEITVRQFKIEIAKQLPIPARKQRLIYQGNVLRVAKNKLSEYNLEDGAEVQVVEEEPPPEEKVGVLPQIPPEEEEETGQAEGGDAEGGPVESKEVEEQQQKKDEEHEKEVQDRDRRNLKDIHRHVKTANKCIEWAGKILDRYERAEAKRELWRRAREAGQELMEIDREDDPDEKPEPRRRHFPWQDEDDEAPLPPLDRGEYAKLLEDLQSMQDRGRPMTDEYHRLVSTDPTMDAEAGQTAERLALTIKDFNYYIGHAMISVSRLQITMNVPPPRNVKLAPTRRTEMRRVMRDLRNMPPRAPSGYIVDIQREGGPVPRGTRNAPAPTDPLTSVALGADKKKKKKKEEEKKGKSTPSEGATGTGPAPTSGATGEEKSVTVGGTFSVDDEGKEGEKKTLDIDVTGVPGSDTHQVSIKERDSGESETQTIPAQDAPAEEAMEQGGKEGAEGEQKEEEPKKERTRDVLAKLLSGMVSGMMGAEEEGEEEKEEEGEGEGEGEGQGKEEEPEKEEEKEEEKKDEEDLDEEDPKKTFAERYVGPPGSIVTIQSIPQPPFGIPTMTPQPGPSLCIRNTGDATKPDVKVNFPMPPALQMLQDLLGGDSSSEDEDVEKPEEEMTEEEKEKKREKERKRAERERKQKEREERRKVREREEKEAKEKERRLRREGRETKPFTAREEAEIAELSDAGSVDSLDSHHDYLETHHVDNPMVRLAISAKLEIEDGIRQTVHDATVDLYAHMGQPPPPEVSEDQGVLEMLFEALSKHLSVIETMAAMWGVEEPMKRLQPCLFQFIKDKMLKGEEPTIDTRRKAVTRFLSDTLSSINSTMITIFPKEGVDLPRTLYNFFYEAMGEVYDVIITKHKDEAAFAKALHAWGTKNSLLFTAILRHVSRNDDLFDDAFKQLFTVFLPGETPAMAMGHPFGAISREVERMKDAHNYSPADLEKRVVYKRGKGPISPAKPKDESSGQGGAAPDSAPHQQPPSQADKQPPPPAPEEPKQDHQEPKPDHQEPKPDHQEPPSEQKEGEQASEGGVGEGKEEEEVEEVEEEEKKEEEEEEKEKEEEKEDKEQESVGREGERGGVEGERTAVSGSVGGRSKETRRTAAEAAGSEKWPDALPKEWVPAIKRDREALARMRPQQPFSDAYVAGMPAKRRKLEAGIQEAASGSDLLGKSLQSAIDNSGATPTSGVTVDAIVDEAKGSEELADGIGKEVHEGVKERLQGDPDYNSEQFPSAEKVFQPNQ